MNIVTEAQDIGAAVLIRGIQPIQGVGEMWENRGKKCPPRAIADGPAKLVTALGIQPEWNGMALSDPACPVFLRPGRKVLADEIVCGPRVGISVGTEYFWRFWVGGGKVLE